MIYKLLTTLLLLLTFSNYRQQKNNEFISGTTSLDYPPNPLIKKGWKVTRHDEFDELNIDSTLWIPYYLRHRSTDSSTKASFTLKDNCLVLQINRTGTRVSSLQTLERENLHKAGKRNIPTLIKFSQKYGFFEIRAKTQIGSGHNCAFWLVGQQDIENQDAEVDVFEQPGDRGNSNVLFNLHEGKDENLLSKKTQLSSWTCKLNLVKDLTKTFNIYGLEWDKNLLRFYFNNKLVKEIKASPDYKMGVLLSLYEANSWFGKVDTTVNYPKEFTIDYFRAYKKVN